MSVTMSAFNGDNYSISAERYLAKYHILTYLEDSIIQLLESKEENAKVVPAKFFKDYFSSLQDGQHTMFREFAYIKSTPHNRISFVALFWKCYRQIGKKGDLLSIQEYHSLIGLLCPDFPFDLVHNIARIILTDDALDCLISFSDFIYAFQVQFYFEEFLNKAYKIYQGLLQHTNSPRDPVIVPTSGETNATVHQNASQLSDGVDAMQFFRAFYPLLNRVDYSTPPLASLKEILFNVERISFYEFLMAIAKSESINAHIGRLPGKIELLEGNAVETTLQQQKAPRQKNKQKARKATENTVSCRIPHKLQGGISRSKSASFYWTSAFVSTDVGSSSVSSSLRTQNDCQVQSLQKISSAESIIESDSESTVDSSDQQE